MTTPVVDLTVDLKDRKYLLSGGWRCSRSPSGAHHWMLLANRGGDVVVGRCAFCGGKKSFPINMDGGFKK